MASNSGPAGRRRSAPPRRSSSRKPDVGHAGAQPEQRPPGRVAAICAVLERPEISSTPTSETGSASSTRARALGQQRPRHQGNQHDLDVGQHRGQPGAHVGDRVVPEQQVGGEEDPRSQAGRRSRQVRAPKRRSSTTASSAQHGQRIGAAEDGRGRRRSVAEPDQDAREGDRDRARASAHRRSRPSTQPRAGARPVSACDGNLVLDAVPVTMTRPITSMTGWPEPMITETERRSASCAGRAAARTGARAARSDGVAIRLHLPEPGPLPMAVVLGLVLHGHRLAPLRSRPLAARAGVAAGRTARGRLHRAHDLLERAADRQPALHLQRDLARRDDDRQHPAAGAGLGVADRGRRPGAGARASRATTSGWPRTAIWTATGCCGSCSPTSRGSTPRPSSTRSGATAPTAGPGSCCWCGATGGSGYDLRRIAAAGGPVCLEVVTNVLYNLSRLALGLPSLTRR